MNRSVLASAAILLVLLIGLGLGVACGAIRAVIVGAGDREPKEFEAGASPEAKALVARALDGLDESKLFDIHAHVAGSEADASGCELSSAMRSWLHPWRRFQLSIYLDAAGVDHIEHGAEEWAARLLSVSRGRVAILGLDHRHREDGSVDLEGTALFVPNDYVFRLVAEHPTVFVAIVSVHPYRTDALLELDRCAARGVKVVKWLPNSMGIDPADPRCDRFYERMKRLGMALLSHAGDEGALAASGDDLGNPLRLRRALDGGVRVIVAHCGSLGEGLVLDDPARREVPNFDLFLRLMDEPRYRGLVYGDLSAVCFRNRNTRALRTLLERTDLHSRLIDGTDWPLPAIRILTSTRRLEQDGFLTKGERSALDEIFTFDPWLFDLVLKRTVRGSKGERFPPEAFQSRPWISP
jgi:predicted TIM-barrel fold metal-dependent hydrolase